MVDLHRDAEVLRALARRRDAGSVAGARSDGHRIALVVCGGGMRGAYAGGMVRALEQAGLTSGIDVAYGASAGAFVAAAALLGHGYDASRIFPDDLARRGFVDPRRIRSRQPMVSLDYLIHDVLVHTRPTNWHALRDSPAPLRVLVTDADDMSPHVLASDGTPGLRTWEDWQLAMRATAAIPLLTGPPVALGGRRWIDGSIGDPLPVARALAEGATHVLVLLTRTVAELQRSDPRAAAPWWARGIDLMAPGLGAMTQDVRRHAEGLALLGDAAHPGRSGRHVETLSPQRSAEIRGLTTDVPRVEQASRLGHEAAWIAIRRALGSDEFSPPAGSTTREAGNDRAG